MSALEMANLLRSFSDAGSRRRESFGGAGRGGPQERAAAGTAAARVSGQATFLTLWALRHLVQT